MSQNIYCNPKVHIEDYGIVEDIKGVINMAGNSQISQMSLTISGLNVPESALMNKRVKFYLNHGSIDSVPFFVGMIRNIKPSDTKVNLTVYDIRCLLGGENAEKIGITETENYDGLTLGGFLVKYINDNINIEKEYIDVSRMNDTEPPIPMSGYRGDQITPYSACLSLIQMATDESDIFNTFQYEIGVKNTTNSTGLFFIKEKDLSSTPSIFMSYGDGIKSYKYKKNKLPTRARQDEIVIDYGGNDNVRIIQDVTVHMAAQNFRNDVKISRADIQKEMFKALIKARKDRFEITIDATKGHYLELGSIVHLNVEEEIKGPHRLVSKNISFSKDMIGLTLKLEAKPNTSTTYA